MSSTGEVACFGSSKEEAFLKSLLSTGFKMPKKNALVSVQEELQDEFTHCAWQLHELGYNLHATKKTADVLEKNRVPCKVVPYPTDDASTTNGEKNAAELIKDGEISLVMNIPTHASKKLEDNYLMR